MNFIVVMLIAGASGMTMSGHSKAESLEEYLSGIHGDDLNQTLDQEMSELARAEVAQSIDDWQYFIPFLGLTNVDRSGILGDHPHNTELQRYNVCIHM